MKLIPTILCGGAGARLWPVSRESHPKPFIRLGDGQSLLQKAFLRGAALPDVAEVLTVTNREFFFQTVDEIQEVNPRGSATAYIVEPVGRNTAAAIAAAALEVVGRHGADALMLVLAADHMVNDESAFAAAIQEAVVLAREGKLVTLGIQPQSPETGFGYIEARGNAVLQFVEKPDAQTAARYVASGRFLWNAGIFCFEAGVLLAQMHTHCPHILSSTRACVALSRSAQGRNYVQLELDRQSFLNVPSESIDYALMEKSGSVAVVPCDIGWSDIGSWKALGDLMSPDENGNRIQGQAVLHDSSDCTIYSAERLTGAVGIHGLVIVDTPDALLVADKSSVQDVKHLYAQLKAQGHAAHQVHRTVHRPWGAYTVLEEGVGFKVKRLVVKPAARLSLQLHHHRSEHWIVVSGTAKVSHGERTTLLAPHESTYIPSGQPHRLENPGILELVMIEVQCGAYLGEDDIVRLDDHVPPA